MLRRIISLSLLLVLSVGIYLPFTDSSAHGVRQSSQVGQKRYKRYRSRAWWRRYRARLKKKRALAAARAHRTALLSLPANLNLGNFIIVAPNSNAQSVSAPAAPVVAKAANTAVAPKVETSALPIAAVPNPPKVVIAPATPQAFSEPAPSRVGSIPFGPKAVAPPVQPKVSSAPVAPRLSAVPVGRTTTSTLVNSSLPTLVNAPILAPPTVNAPAPSVAKTAEARPVNEARVVPKSPVSPLPGELSISVVALSRPNPAFLTAREESRLLSGIPVADLRRIVIDRMVVAGGWVTNDFVREINGGRVFIVTARTPRDGQTPEKAWTFYFTESGGRIYSLTTDSPVDHVDRMAKEAERFIGTLRSTPEK